MPFRFHVLASGSSGNACVLEIDDFAVLIDFGLSPRMLAPRMNHCRLSWQRIRAVILMHPHSDHWRASTLRQIAKLGLPMYCHAEHLNDLDQTSRAFEALESAKLFRHYEPGAPIELHAGVRCLPIELPHDGTRTCGFRFEGATWALGYLADLGSWNSALAKWMADVDLLALEFNHDVEMQMNSGRHPTLIRRVLGDHGHLSNEQAADFLSEIIKCSEAGRIKHLVQLHLSRQCNYPDLAHDAARQALGRLGIELPIYTAHQDQEGRTIDLREPSAAFVQAALPFAD